MIGLKGIKGESKENHKVTHFMFDKQGIKFNLNRRGRIKTNMCIITKGLNLRSLKNLPSLLSGHG